MFRISKGLDQVVDVDQVEQIEPAIQASEPGATTSTRSSASRYRPATQADDGESPPRIRMVPLCLRSIVGRPDGARTSDGSKPVHSFALRSSPHRGRRQSSASFSTNGGPQEESFIGAD